MFVMSKRNIVIPSPDGAQSVRLHAGFVGEIPAWAASTPYFAGLVADGKIVIPESRKDKATQEAAERPTKTRRKKAE